MKIHDKTDGYSCPSCEMILLPHYEGNYCAYWHCPHCEIQVCDTDQMNILRARQKIFELTAEQCTAFLSWMKNLDKNEALDELTQESEKLGLYETEEYETEETKWGRKRIKNETGKSEETKEIV